MHWRRRSFRTDLGTIGPPPMSPAGVDLDLGQLVGSVAEAGELLAGEGFGEGELGGSFEGLVGVGGGWRGGLRPRR